MPTISVFYGVAIRMYWADHTPPHFHAVYGEFEATIAIDGLSVLRGRLPRRAMALTFEWASAHREELLEDWKLCAMNLAPRKIQPLE